MSELVGVVNRLQDVLTVAGCDTIDLPQIVVVGSQSSGKSSVIESILGFDVLPRGSGIVTRRPLVLQLINEQHPSAMLSRPSTPPNGSAVTQVNGTAAPAAAASVVDDASSGIQSEVPQPRAMFLHLPGRVFTDFVEVRKEIERETERLAGFNKGIVNNPIHLKVYSPNVLNLTLVDLPGITKIPIGDQPTDIEKLTRQLVLDYITNPNSLILAVSPANVDLVNSESLKLAREVDPEGKRTLGVITKIDLMDAGTNALDILTGRVYPLRLGFVGVVNRSQQDTVANKPISDALANETKFFRSHPVYRTIANRCGTAHLTKTLHSLLIAHIRERLPEIKTKVSGMISQTERELQSLGGEPASVSDIHRPALFLRLLTQFTNAFNASIDGTADAAELCGGARLYHIFHHTFGTSLDSINPTANLSSQEIRTAIRNSTGARASLFVPEIAFELLVKPQIKLLEAPGQRCVQLAYEELMRICSQAGSSSATELRRYPKLQTRIIEVVSNVLRECVGPAGRYLENMIAIERAYINTNHPDFIGGQGAIAQLEKMADKARRDRRRAVLHGLATSDSSSDLAAHVASASASKQSHNVDSDSEGLNIAIDTDSGTVQQQQSSSSSSRKPLPNFAGERGLANFMGAVRVDRQQQQQQPQQPSTRHGRREGSVSGRSSLSNSIPSSILGDALIPQHQQSSSSSLSPQVPLQPEQLSQRLDSISLTDREELETQLIRLLIGSYFDIVRKTVRDQVPKAIMHLLVIKTRETIPNRLVEELYTDKLMTELLEEDEETANERQRCMSLLAVYKKAYTVLADV